jgi:hypothetical protein
MKTTCFVEASDLGGIFSSDTYFLSLEKRGGEC